jgi:penicillin amidase/acyl-homoserine-lactone acylase
MKPVTVVLAVIGAAALAAAVYLWAPSGPAFDAGAARAAAQSYDPRIIRDRYGVPHILGARDADVAFGLAYAHAEDDWKTLEEVLFFSRGRLASRIGKDGAVTDYLIAALGIWRDIDAKYKDLDPETRAIVEAYAAGLNLFCAERSVCAGGAAPVTGKDIVAGFASRTPFFYGLDVSFKQLFAGDEKRSAALESLRTAFLHLAPGAELGSNAMAVAPSRSADGHTRLMVNSHQPYTGPVAWYEARVKSDEGWDMIGGVFPGSPVILHGVGPDLGWAHTVNSPDLVDVFALKVDNAKNPTRYMMDGEWRELERGVARFRVKLFGPFSLPVARPIYRSVHGPVFVTPTGVFAVSYGGAGDIRAVEQWRRMNKAKDFSSWRAAMEMQAIPSLNAVYADRSGMIAYIYNAAIPDRSAEQDWSVTADGSRLSLVWKGVLPFGTAPSVVAPASGYVVNANHTPFQSSAPADNPDPSLYPAHLGIDQRTTNRGIRIQELYGGDDSITAEEFVSYKMDALYAPDSRLRRLIARLIEREAGSAEPDVRAALEVLSSWDGSTERRNRAAALAVRIGYLALGHRLIEAPEEIAEKDEGVALRRAIAEFKEGFGRIDPEWGEAVRLIRGDLSLPLDGGPDTLRAVYPAGEPTNGVQPAAGGDTYIVYADWPADGGAALIRTIHQFGSATLDQASPHYADQAPLFAEEQWKTPPMKLDALLAEATRDYRPGR